MSVIEELENEARIWEQNAKGVLLKLEDERVKNISLQKLIWAIVLKHGGETSLSVFEQGELRDDWEIEVSVEPETLNLTIKARVK